MKKKLALIAVTTALLALVIAPTFAFAQDTETTSVRPIKDGLAIVAPRAAAVGQKISITVFQCSDQTPVSGAGVWALTPEKLEPIKGQLPKNKGNDDSGNQDKQYEELLGVHGTFLGRTDALGKLWYTFNDAGRYTLVTFKAGYWPDMRVIVIGNPSGTVPRLVIDAPNRAEVGEKITITVTQKDTQEPVKDAGVWALSRDKAESLKAAISSQKAGDQDALATQIESALNVSGIFLGTTNGAGKLGYAFENAGGYLLVTFKRGCLPGFKPILIGSTPKVLSIDAPNKAKVDEKITITVTERGTQEPVKDAGVWALTRENAASIKAAVASVKTAGADAAAIQAQIESLLNTNGIFLGTTNGTGKVQYAFEKAGGYLLVTFKPGYWPGLKPILIIGNTPQPSTSNRSISVQ
ncbi:MAG TPA: hypothetical protein VGA85_04340 [Dehalococcoidales bacterium]